MRQLPASIVTVLALVLALLAAAAAPAAALPQPAAATLAARPVAVVGTAVPAAAAKTTVALNNSPLVTYYPSATVNIKTKNAKGLRAALQRYSGSKWVTVWKAPTSVAKSSQTVAASYKFSKRATVKVRGTLLKGSKIVARSASQSLSYQKWPTWVQSAQGSTLFEQNRGRVAAGEKASHTLQLYYTDVARKGRFQEYRGGKWVTLKNLNWKPQPGSWYSTAQTVTTPATTKTASKKYRLVVDSTANDAGLSQTVTIRHENPEDYTGYAQQAHEFIQDYCPSTMITVRPGSYAESMWPENRIELYPGLTELGLKYVALHECAHVVQRVTFNNDHARMSETFNAIYKTTGSTGYEQAADCMAFAMGAPDNWAYYTSNCKGERGAAAAAVLAGKIPSVK
ncbi:hypothetical protein LVY72_08750 [Arthrobacter sp. I2-34]|uniref:Uncharacterized protein n=1 Tax=Arthrobacter hankyongi TaxID=2904801 RepID=A0ABS9L5Q2_9MICC|nr:hypothetical protein [Arthrobacter hankyongi]MCG2622005.1 hypothetical protein [Arthrobacter hankyongi]